MLEKAILIATEAHSGQLDKVGDPYILHPLYVMNRVHDFDSKIVAVLHDVVEDTDWSLADLKNEGFSPKILEAVAAITHIPNEPNVSYWDRVKKNPIALGVKIRDMQHNMSEERVGRLPLRDKERILKKYSRGLIYLSKNSKESYPKIEKVIGAEIVSVGVSYLHGKSSFVLKKDNEIFRAKIYSSDNILIEEKKGD